jgi:Cu-Zn family superoxide dismutase
MINQKNSFYNRLASKFAVILSCVTFATVTTTAGAIAQNASARIFDNKGLQVGSAQFVQTSLGVQVSLEVQNLNMGEHMVHIHENGRCDAPEFKTSGKHFAPNHDHKDDHKDHDQHLHMMHNKHEASKHKPAGDLPNIVVGGNGRGTLTAILSGLSLGTAKNSLLKQGGTSILIHAGANGKSTIPNLDYKTRIACGVIEK